MSLAPATCLSDSDSKIAVVISRKIKPYIQVSEGISSGISNGNQSVEMMMLSPGDERIREQIISQLTQNSYELVAAVGPEAAVLIWGLDTPLKKMYTAVLDPGSLAGLSPEDCGIPLRVPVPVQLERIFQTFENLKRIGLIFDPRHNQWFYEQARIAAHSLPFEIIPLKVKARNQIPKIIKPGNVKIDAFWMIPDQTVISEKIIQYVIKQGIYNGIGVIGYNSFFTRSGALFSFEFEYENIGYQTAEKINKFLGSGECSSEAPVFRTVVNQNIAQKLGIRVKK